MSDPNKQFNCTLSLELKARLKQLAKENQMSAPSEVGADIIKRFIEPWAQLQERIREGKKRVEQEIMESLERPPLVKGATEQRKNPRAGRKRR